MVGYATAPGDRIFVTGALELRLSGYRAFVLSVSPPLISYLFQLNSFPSIPSKMLDDSTLATVSNFMGFLIFLLVLLYHNLTATSEAVA